MGIAESGPDSKVKVKTQLVEMDGDEMPPIIRVMIKERPITRFLAGRSAGRSSGCLQ
jgi:hypothetical protein